MAMVSMMACTISCCCICILGLAKLIGLVHLMKCITSQSQNSRLRSFSFPVMLVCMCGIHSLFLLLVLLQFSYQKTPQKKNKSTICASNSTDALYNKPNTEHGWSCSMHEFISFFNFFS